MKNILVIYYSQTGQIKKIIDSIIKPFEKTEFNVDFIEIKPETEYPFPWPADKFFDVFPESKAGISCKLKPIELDNPEKYDLIILGLQVWYLEPSIPMASFLKSDYAKILNNKPVITVYGVRNMWINAHQEIKRLINNAKGKLIGNTVFADRHNNLISVLTIVRWLFKGQKEASKFLPSAGVSDAEIKEASKFGNEIIESLQNSELEQLQQKLAGLGAVKVDYHIMKTEFAGSRIFDIWSTLILKKSSDNLKKRKRLLKIFKYYLYFVLFIISPFSSVIFKIIRLFFPNKTQKQIVKHTSLIS